MTDDAGDEQVRSVSSTDREKPKDRSLEVGSNGNDLTGEKPADSEPRAHRTRNVPWLVIGGSIAVPLVAAAAAFGGAIWGAGSQTADNRETIKAERDRLYEQFLLTQRQEQYAAIRQQATRLENASDFSTTGLTVGLPITAGIGMSTADSEDADDAGGDANPPPNRYSEVDPYSVGIGNYLFGGTRYTSEQYNNSYYGAVASSWQDAYTGLDQAISNAEIASSDEVINIARALRDRYRKDYYQSVLKTIDERILPEYPPDVPKPDRLELADALVGVPAEDSRTYPEEMSKKSTEELTREYVRAVKDDLEP